MSDVPMLEMRGITKRFPGVLANDQVDFDLRAGEVHTLLGENGAGKSTLMKILYGLYRQDEGEVLLNGSPIEIQSPTDAIDHNIGMIHQHFMMVESLTVAENVALGLPSNRGFRTDLDAVSERIVELGDRYGLQIDPTATVWQLSVGQKQRVEIIKALYRNAELLILDEPTAVLTPQEVDQLFVTLRQMTDDGKGLIFISHKLHEVLALSDRISVLRQGRKTGEVPVEGATRESLARMMVGREVKLAPDKPAVETGPARLRIENLTVLGDRGDEAVRGLNLEVRAGEILGIAGVSGNGQREMAETIGGLREPISGSIYIDDVDVAGKPPARYPPSRSLLCARRTHEERLYRRVHHLGEPSAGRSQGSTVRQEGPLRLRSDQGTLCATGQGVCGQDADAGDHRSQPVRREHPEGDPGSGDLGNPQGTAGLSAHPRCGHRRRRVHPQAAGRPAGSRHRHPGHLRRPRRGIRPIRSHRGHL